MIVSSSSAASEVRERLARHGRAVALQVQATRDVVMTVAATADVSEAGTLSVTLSRDQQLQLSQWCLQTATSLHDVTATQCAQSWRDAERTLVDAFALFLFIRSQHERLQMQLLRLAGVDVAEQMTAYTSRLTATADNRVPAMADGSTCRDKARRTTAAQREARATAKAQREAQTTPKRTQQRKRQ